MSALLKETNRVLWERKWRDWDANFSYRQSPQCYLSWDCRVKWNKIQEKWENCGQRVGSVCAKTMRLWPTWDNAEKSSVLNWGDRWMVWCNIGGTGLRSCSSGGQGKEECKCSQWWAFKGWFSGWHDTASIQSPVCSMEHTKTLQRNGEGSQEAVLTVRVRGHGGLHQVIGCRWRGVT